MITVPTHALKPSLMRLALMILFLAACTTTPAPTPIAANHDWTPQTRTDNGVEMVKVPAGCFVMGEQNGRRDERPANKQCFTSAFWIDKYEVTNAQYGSEGVYAGPQRPRENLTWAEARDFCRQRGARLPTEAEWEYAARGPDGLIYPWGDVLIGAYLQYDQNSTEPADVGSHPGGVSWVGALDMSGNVWEWVSSEYKPYPYNASDGREAQDDASVKRVFRGGWLSYIDGGSGAVMRFRMAGTERDWRVGFRCAKDE
ncbi:MAG: formylglycine-generating enzyme family protein [Anaerolineae bacterium]|nr:formylglycine-generating enzyme family protein [Anaerolineae bacterium]